MKLITKKILAGVLVSAILSFTTYIATAQFPFNVGGNGDGSNNASGQSIARDANNNVYITGCFKGTAIFPAAGSSQVTITNTGYEDIYVAKFNPSGECQWAFNIGSTNSAINNGLGISADANGNVYVTGYFAGTADFKGKSAGPHVVAVSSTTSSNGGQDIFVAKYNTAGEYQWAFSIDCPSTNNPYAADGIEGNGIAVDGLGNVFVTGQYVGTADFKGTSAGPDTLKSIGKFASAMFLAKYNSDGAYQWAFDLNDGTISNGLAVATDANNNVVVTGIFTKTGEFKGTSGTSNPLTVVGNSGQQIFVAKYDGSGANQWAFCIGAAGETFDQYVGFQFNDYYEAGITTDASGNIYVTGNFSGAPDFKGTSAGPNTLSAIGSTDAFVARYNPGGAYQWALTIGGAGNNARGEGVAADADGNVYVTGNFDGTVDFKGTSAGPNILTAIGTLDIFVAKYDKTGAYQCAFNIGSGYDNSGNAIATDSLGNTLITGLLGGTADFDPSAGTSNLTSAGNEDAFVAKYTGCSIFTGCTANAGSNQSICQGVNTNATIGVAAVGGHTYSWSPATGLSSSTISQPTANPTTTTTYTLTETITATACQATATIIVFVGIQPTTPVITPSGPTTFCSDTNVVLNTGGGYTNYLWSNAATTQNIKINKQGSYSVTVSDSPGCSAVSTATDVTVNPSPAATTGPNKAICKGVSVAIGAAPINGHTYNWSPVTGLSSATVSQPTANPTVSTWYTLTESIITGGCTASDSVLVNVHNLPAKPVISPSGSTTFCSGQTVTLNITGSYTTYVWSTGATTQSINAGTQGKYSVTVTNSSGCSAASDGTDITVNQSPAPPDITQKGDTLICSVTASGYQWYLEGSPVSGATNKFYLPSQKGNYTVTITEGGCSSTSSSLDYNGAGINAVIIANEMASIYPSPASNYFTLESKTTPILYVTLYDVLGNKILILDTKEIYTRTDGRKATINIEALPSGIYFVQMRTSNAVSTLRLVKQ